MMEAITEFFNMGGYALYVWGSFGMTALLMIMEPIMLKGRRKTIVQRINRLIRIKAEERA